MQVAYDQLSTDSAECYAMFDTQLARAKHDAGDSYTVYKIRFRYDSRSAGAVFCSSIVLLAGNARCR